jgi:phage shock protein C
MTTTTTIDTVPLPLRSYTLLGVCEAIGEDFGFNANYLRVPLGAIVVFNVWAAVGAYVALGLVVLASRLLFPTRTAAEVSTSAGPVPANRDVEEKLAA